MTRMTVPTSRPPKDLGPGGVTGTTGPVEVPKTGPMVEAGGRGCTLSD